ncbi:MAG: acyl carrier protein [Hyphomonas sp.]|uniref:acyl carrier protein n=1 Tax=Hyphomonas sp. TaxID=87 RepID=UPI00349FDA4C
MKLDQASLFDEISKVLSARSHTGITITPETRIGADLEIDSVEIFDIVMELEDLYDISFPIEQASNIDTVRDLVATIRQLANV